MLQYNTFETNFNPNQSAHKFRKRDVQGNLEAIAEAKKNGWLRLFSKNRRPNNLPDAHGKYHG